MRRNEMCVFPPKNPPVRRESRFVLLDSARFDPAGGEDEMLGTAPYKSLEWKNRPSPGKDYYYGGGLGFPAALIGVPQIEYIPKLGRQPEDIEGGASSYFILSPRALSIFKAYCGDDLEVCTPEWIGKSPASVKGHVLVDVRRVYDAYDYDRCEIKFARLSGGQGFVGMLGRKLAFRSDLPMRLHAFRDLYARKPLILSRELAVALREAGMTGAYYLDPADTSNAFYEEELEAAEERDRIEAARASFRVVKSDEP